ncbi:MAG: hypothetical protein QOG15_2585 [Solirubrobacteraceae bacterium]|jgi:heme/copper-type cytochrome/quinol oxidase subunit 2|nr:hypothetical protein [Solirubrobacteraceae bacterium]
MREAVAMMQRVTLVLLGLLVLTVIFAFVVPQPERPDDPTPRTTGAAASGEPLSETVQGTLPRDKEVRAHVGDVIELTVTAKEPDSATVAAFGVTDAASPGAPAHFSFVADFAGRYPVRLLLTNERVGWLIVK